MLLGSWMAERLNDLFGPLFFFPNPAAPKVVLV